MIWIAIVIVLACVVAWSIIDALSTIDHVRDELVDDDVEGAREAVAHLYEIEPHHVDVLRTCRECGGTVDAQDGAVEAGRWLCADCLVEPGELEVRRGNVISLDDRRRAS